VFINLTISHQLFYDIKLTTERCWIGRILNGFMDACCQCLVTCSA